MINKVSHKILVVGGGGFIGSEICRVALRGGHHVTSISRSGKPKQENPGNKDVKWVKGDAFKPETYMADLGNCDTVVHSMGILMENDYKKVINFSPQGNGYMNEQHDIRRENENADSVNYNTYEKMNRDSAAEAGVKTFVYISAISNPPFIDKRYITTKREAEDGISKYSQFRSVFFRPVLSVPFIIKITGLVYSDSRIFTIPLAFGLKTFNFLSQKTPLGCLVKSTPLKDLDVPPVTTTELANSVVSAIENPELEGIISPQGILDISSKYQL
ncbi:hypothetical protein BB560_001074 [Smittium megazygosporum]|uniref:NAD(P)-binding domain-containing protein n=1 Tax=Smittium megazygosporum TaxID=133381 RepID=A0A2T9ZIM0_9FUNG|nr:hypothetical protein BB560_001074 [Smittium megazygosporum]